MSVEDKDEYIEEIEQEEEILQEENLPEEPEDEEEPEEGGRDIEVVEQAKKYGHLDKEEWVAQGRNPEDWKSPEEFHQTGKILEQVYSLKKKVDQRDREIQALVDYQQRTSQREYDKAKQELEQRLAIAKDDMDVEGVARYSQDLVRIQDTQAQSQAQQWQQAQKSAQDAFLERNQHWFNDRNPDLKERAIAIDKELKDAYPNATYEQLAQKIETRMQYDYPERVLGGNSGSKRPVPVASSPSQSSVNKSAVNKGASGKKAFQSLSQDHKDTYNATKRIVESMGNREYTYDEFISQLKKDGEL